MFRLGGGTGSAFGPKIPATKTPAKKRPTVPDGMQLMSVAQPASQPAQPQPQPQPAQQPSPMSWGDVRRRIESGEWTNRQGRNYILDNNLQSPSQQQPQPAPQPAPQPQPPPQPAPAPAPAPQPAPQPAAGPTLEDRIRAGEFGSQGTPRTLGQDGQWRDANGNVVAGPRGVTVSGGPTPEAPQPAQQAAPQPAPQPQAPVSVPASGQQALRQVASRGELGFHDLSGDAIQRAVFERGMRQLGPMMEDARRRKAVSLEARGIPVDSDIFRREMARFEQSQADALADLSNRAIQAGAQEQSRQVGLLQSLRGQAFGEMNANRRFGEGQRRFDLSRGDANRRFDLSRGDMLGQQGWQRQMAEQQFQAQQTQQEWLNRFAQQGFDANQAQQAWQRDFADRGFTADEAQRAWQRGITAEQMQMERDARDFDRQMAERGMSLQERESAFYQRMQSLGYSAAQAQQAWQNRMAESDQRHGQELDRLMYAGGVRE